MGPFLAPPPLAPLATRDAPPTFSVLVAAYNAAAFIGDALESALSQRPAPLEVVVCDDGSTDDFVGAVAPFRDRVTVIHQANQGDGVAKTSAARVASGEFVVLLDADDLYLPGRLEALGELARARPDLDLLTTDAYLMIDGERRGRYYGQCAEFVVEEQERAIIRSNFVFGLAAARRERMLAVGGWEGNARYACDWQGWLRMVLSGARVGLVDEPLASYVRHGGAASTRRVEIGQARIDMLRGLRQRFDLDEGQQADLDEFVDWQLGQLPVERLMASLRTGAPGARATAWELCHGPGHTRSERALAALATLSPRLVGAASSWAGTTPCGEPRSVAAALLEEVRRLPGRWPGRAERARDAQAG